MLRPSTTLETTVKWFEPGKELWVHLVRRRQRCIHHITALRRSGVDHLDPGQRVRIEAVDGKKGQEVERIIPM